MMLRRASIAARKKSITGLVTLSFRMRSSTCKRCRPKRRIVSAAPSSDSGSMTALTREPSPRRASTIGDASSMRRPSGVMMRSMTETQLLLVAKALRRELDDSVTLDVNSIRAVYHNFADVRILHEVFERPQPQSFIDDLLAKPRDILRRSVHVVRRDVLGGDRFDLRA